MTVEQLLVRRKKVMIDFPQWSVFKHKKGDILTIQGIHFVGNGTSKSLTEKEIENYPEIFREMVWWEEREEKDMPEYVKWDGEIYKSKKWVFENDFHDRFPYVFVSVGHLSVAEIKPATKEEYESQNK